MLFPFCITKSQERATITISGWFDKNNQYRSPFLSREIDNILFLELKGKLFQPSPRRGFYMKLDEASALETGYREIFIVPANEAGEERFWWGTEEKMTIDVSPLPGDGYIFYCNDEKLISPGWKRMLDEEAAFWENPRSLDLDKENIGLSADNRFIPLYIKQLDNHSKITLSGTIIEEKYNVFADARWRVIKTNRRAMSLKDSLNLSVDGFHKKLKRPFTLDIDSPYFKFGKYPPVEFKFGAYSLLKKRKTYFWQEEYTISDLALEQLKEVWLPRFVGIPETFQENADKADWKKWYSSLPAPLFEKPDVNLTYEEVKWDWTIAYYLGKEYFFQDKENHNIYLFLPDSSYMFDTRKDALISIEKEESDYPAEIWESKQEYENPKVELWIEQIKEDKLVYFDQYYQLPDGDICITIVSTNGFQEQLHVYLMKKGARKPYKKLYVDSLIPIENSSEWGIHIMDVFQAHGKYYLIANINRTKAYWVVLNKGMFSNF